MPKKLTKSNLIWGEFPSGWVRTYNVLLNNGIYTNDDLTKIFVGKTVPQIRNLLKGCGTKTAMDIKNMVTLALQKGKD